MTVRVLVNGREHGGWKEIEISAGIDRMARDFRLAATWRWPGQDIARPIQPGDRCAVYIGDDLVVTGHADAAPVRYDAREIRTGVIGRSLTADLIDCAAADSPGQFRGRRFEQIAAALAQPYGVDVLTLVDTGPAIADHQVTQGETVQESLDDLARKKGLLLTDNARGQLVITRAGAARADSALKLGDNILEGTAGFDMSPVFSQYVVKGQSAGDDMNFGASAAHHSGLVTDATIGRLRRLLTVESGAASQNDCRNRARWEAAHRAAGVWKTEYVVQGWRQESGALWQPNQVVRISDQIMGFDVDMLIGEVTYRLSADGETTTLTVAPAAAWELNPIVKSAKSASGLQVRPGETLIKFD